MEGNERESLKIRYDLELQGQLWKSFEMVETLREQTNLCGVENIVCCTLKHLENSPPEMVKGKRSNKHQTIVYGR